MKYLFQKLGWHTASGWIQFMDTVLFGAMVWAALFRVLQRNSYRMVLSGIGAFVSVSVSVWMTERAARRRVKELHAKAKQELIAERLLLMPFDQVSDRVAPDAVLQLAEIRLDDLFPLMRKKVQTIWFCGKAEKEVVRFITEHSETATVHWQEETLERFQDLISNEEVEQRVQSRMHPQRKRFPWKHLLKNIEWNRFLILGVILLTLSFLTRFPIYYRLTATIAFAVGTAIRWRDKELRHRAEKESLLP